MYIKLSYVINLVTHICFIQPEQESDQQHFSGQYSEKLSNVNNLPVEFKLFTTITT